MAHHTGSLLALSDMPLFDGLSEPCLRFASARVRQRRFAAGANVMAMETQGDALYFIMAGTVKIKIDQPDGGEVIIAMLGPGEVVGELSVLDSAGRSADVVTQEPSLLAWMDRASFEELLQQSPELSRNVVKMLVRRVRLSTEQIRALCSLDVYGKVARQLLVFAQQYGVPTVDGTHIPMRLTQGDVAGLVGASRERVNQVFGNLRRRGLIRIDTTHRVTVRDAAKLRQIVDER